MSGSRLALGGRSLDVTFVLTSATISVIVEIYICNLILYTMCSTVRTTSYSLLSITCQSVSTYPMSVTPYAIFKQFVSNKLFIIIIYYFTIFYNLFYNLLILLPPFDASHWAPTPTAVTPSDSFQQFIMIMIYYDLLWFITIYYDSLFAAGRRSVKTQPQPQRFYM